MGKARNAISRQLVHVLAHTSPGGLVPLLIEFYEVLLERRKKVFQELRRPAFSVFEQGPLSKLCSYLPYEKVKELAEDPNLEYLKPEVLDKLEEWPGE